MKSTCELIQQLSESNSIEDKKNRIGQLKQIVSSQNGNFVIGNVKKLFSLIENLIKDPFLDIVIETIDLLNHLLTSTDPEIQIYTTKIQPSIVPALSSDNFAVRAAAIACESRYLKISNNNEAALSAIQKYGIESANESERVNSADAVLKLATQNETILDEVKNKIEIRKILQSLISHMKSDPSERVRTSFANILIQMTQTFPGIYRVSRELTFPFMTTYDELLEQEHITVNKTNINEYKGLDNAVTNEITKAFNYKMPKKDKGLEFGIIPARIINELNPAVNWKQRAGAIEELEEIVKKENNANLIEPFLQDFFKLLGGLLNDPNYKVSVTTLQMISNKLLINLY